jgi:hypothetical protein
MWRRLPALRASWRLGLPGARILSSSKFEVRSQNLDVESQTFHGEETPSSMAPTVSEFRARLRPVSWQDVKAVLDRTVSLTPHEVLLLVVLAEDVRKAGGPTRPGQARIVRRSGLSVRYVRQALASLSKRGSVRLETPQTATRPAVYRIDLAALATPAPDAGGASGAGPAQHAGGARRASGTGRRPPRHRVPEGPARGAGIPLSTQSQDQDLRPAGAPAMRMRLSLADVRRHLSAACHHLLNQGGPYLAANGPSHSELSAELKAIATTLGAEWAYGRELTAIIDGVIGQREHTSLRHAAGGRA